MRNTYAARIAEAVSEDTMKAAEIAEVLARNPRALPKRIRVVNGHSGQWECFQLLEALSILYSQGILAGFDGEDAGWTGNGYIEIWLAGEAVPYAA